MDYTYYRDIALSKGYTRPQFFAKTMSFNELPPEWLYKRVCAIVESDSIDQLTELALNAIFSVRKKDCVDSFDLWQSYIEKRKSDIVFIPADDKTHFDALISAYIAAGYQEKIFDINHVELRKDRKPIIIIKY